MLLAYRLLGSFSGLTAGPFRDHIDHRHGYIMRSDAPSKVPRPRGSDRITDIRNRGRHPYFI
jgi:hypothetical protein